ncbi:serine protease [Verrucomicrobia bacterium]|jgi:hypothetical protein|nr:serine protease [Verrucomicrobiota bacterium]MDA7657407.1 serine protease [Verrucomicrobiota bacterium]
MTTLQRIRIPGSQTDIRSYRLQALQMGLTLLLFGLSDLSILLCNGENMGERNGLAPRIVGGRVAAPVEYPWMTALVQSGDPVAYRGLISGGILIHPQWILTAAHSVEGKRAEDVHALAGIKNLVSDTNIARRSIVEIVRHPSYGISKGRLGSDLALLKLANRVESNSTLPLSNSLGGTRTGTMTRTMGWGRTADRGLRSVSLRAVDVPVVSEELIDAIQIYGEELPRDLLLAGDSAGERDTCDGDSGGPLLERDRLRGEWRLLAVVAGGSDLGCAIIGAPGLYTSIESHLSWIESIVVERFEDWAVLHGVSKSDMDSDDDGFSNWDEYARMTLPLNPKSYPRLVYGLIEIDGESYPTLGGFARVGIADVQFWVAVSSDLDSWRNIAKLSEQHVIGKATMKTVFRWKNPLPLSDMLPQFFRVFPLQNRPTGAFGLKSNSSSLMLTNQ